MSALLIFAYGSNMCMGRLRSRVPSARVVGVAQLRGYTLRFHKGSDDGSGKADALKTGSPEDVVWGVVCEIDPSDKPRLDAAEGLGRGYREQQIEVSPSSGGGSVSALAYFAEPAYIDHGLKPFAWYRRFVAEGARQHDLPSGYIRAIETIEVGNDPDLSRSHEAEHVVCREPEVLSSGERAAVRQTRLFVPNQPPYDDRNWAETVLGRIVGPLVDAQAELTWFWFSRYGPEQKPDAGDWEMERVAEMLKETTFRYVRFRFALPTSRLKAFELRVKAASEREGCVVVEFSDYDPVEDLGSDRFVGELRTELRRRARSDLVVSYLHVVSRLVLQSLVGPDTAGRFRLEQNDNIQNPGGSTFVSIHHLLWNIAGLPPDIERCALRMLAGSA